MAREKRKRSKTGMYHIMLCGIDRRNIFFEDEDREKFIQALMKAKKVGGFSLYAYCLMDNHVHLLIKENEDIGNSMKRITVSYVQWHNKKYGRTGRLFQDRYKSEVVESEAYFLTVTRYIHQNPVKARITQLPSKYVWSSYNIYIDKYHGGKVELDTDIVENYFNNEESFKDYMTQSNTDKCLEYNQKVKYTDEELKEQLKSQININEMSSISRSDRDKTIAEIRKDTGVSIRQLSRVLGIGRGIVEKASKK